MMTRDHVHLTPLGIIHFPLKKGAEWGPFLFWGIDMFFQMLGYFNFFPKKEGYSTFLWDKNINLTFIKNTPEGEELS